MHGRFSNPFAVLVATLATTSLIGACTTDMPQLANPAPAAQQPAPDPETLAAQNYFARVQANYLAQGLLRQDGGGRDTPFDARDLSENFLRIAFFDEFSDEGGHLVPGGAQSRLHRWEGPIRMALEFGPSVPAAQQAQDRTQVTAYLARLSALSGLRAEMVDAKPNYLVMIQGPAERRAAKERILAFAPGTSRAALVSALNMRNDVYCTVFSYSNGASSRYDSALAVIRSELPPLMRKACIHEELAQGLGLINDSPKARPSIFNDDQEFALLSRQDALMLRLLYDRRLRPGMTLDEARPIVETIAAELLPDQS